MNIRELFKRKLDSAEVIPGPAVNAKLMRKLAQKEFVRFNPSRFNAYYLGGVLVAAVTTGIILFSEQENPASLNTNTNTEVTDNRSGIKTFEVPEAVAIVKGSDNRLNAGDAAIIEQGGPREKSKPEVEADRNIIQSERTIIPVAGINNSISKKGIFGDSFDEAEKLKKRIVNEETVIQTSAISGCVPLKLNFNARVDSYDSCQWNFGDGGYSNRKNTDWIFDVDGQYKVVLNVYSGGKLESTSSTYITVYPRPQARFEITPEKVVLPDDEIRFLNYSANAIRYRWSFGDGTYSNLFEPVQRYDKYSNYNVKLVVTSEFGCSDSLVVMNAFSGTEYFISFPNAFIPNPDGPSGGFYSNKSDESGRVFHPTFSGVTEYQLRIFSKIGLLIFESNDVNTGWDGYFKGQMANPGVYIWKVRGSYRNGEPFVKMGDVTLLRN